MSKSGDDNFTCLVCGEEDPITQAVECSTCRSRYHRNCVVANDNMSTWDCLNCKTKIAPPAPKSKRSKSVRSNISSTSSQRLALQKLEEEKQLLQRTIDEKLRVEKEFLHKKYEILQQEGSRASGSIISSKEKVEQWMNESEQIDVAPASTSAVLSSAVNDGNVVTITVPTTNVASAPSSALLSSTVNDINFVSISTPGTNVFSTYPHHDNQLNNKLGVNNLEPIQEKSETITNSSPIKPIVSSCFPQTSGTIATSSTNVPMVSTGIDCQVLQTGSSHYNSVCQSQPNQQSKSAVTSFQHHVAENDMGASRSIANHHQISKSAMAARQVIPKELPIFSGNPSEWPEFVAAYEFTTGVCELSEYENAGRLQKYLSGIAFDAVRHTLYLPGGASNAVCTLRRLFGQPEFIINDLLERLRQTTKPEQDDIDSIIQFSLQVENLYATMKKASLNTHLSNPILMQELIGYLPSNLKFEWAKHKYHLKSCDLEAFMIWLKEESNALLSVLQRAPFQHKKEHVNIHVDSRVSNNCIICNKACSSVADCSSFSNEKLSKRWELVKSKSLCRTCLKCHRGACRNKVKCEINGCQYYHNKLLHNYGNDGASGDRNQQVNDHQVHYHKDIGQRTFFKIVPVILSMNNKHVSTYAILDDCSSITLLEQSISDALGLSGQTLPLCLKWTGETTRTEESSKLVCVEISGVESTRKYKLDRVRTVSRLNLPKQTQNVQKLQTFQHLKGVPLPTFNEAVPQMLIGLSHAKLLSTTRIKIGKDNEPLAAKTPLGWVVYGGLGVTNHQVLHINEVASNDILDGEVQSYFALESSGVTPSLDAILSAEEIRANEIMEKTTTFKGSFYETGLLWKFDNISLPYSYDMAKNRLLQLERRLLKEPMLAQSVQSQINDYIQKGYARVLSDDEVDLDDKQSWYLPIFVVCNPNKPNKIRLVWDAAAKVRDISLNSMLLKGPDMLTSLPGILRRFRERKIGFTGDIKEMFHQVHIKKEDQKYQRFLWRFNKKEKPQVLSMKVMTFGATCSPACASYVLNLNAKRFLKTHPEAVQSIKKSHYVDDLLESRESTEEAIKLAKDIRKIHKEGGFEIRNWASNDAAFLKTLNDNSSEITKSIELQPDSNVEKVLGLWWDTNSDTFTFLLKYNKANKSILNGSAVPSKRDVLRTLMSIFDPLGLISHILIYPKILLQDIWRAGLSWDEPIHERFFKQWELWVRNLPSIEQLAIPRCYQIRTESTIQLHTFVDASEEAFACTIYARICTYSTVHCVLVASKSKVAPLKPLSMPRLELQAALIGARMTANIKEEHNFKISGEFYWSDSLTVLSWLRSDARRYRQFVAVRIGEILELTTVSAWRWVPTKLNMADMATRKVIQNISSGSTWFRGPDFLYEDESLWPLHKFKKVELEEVRSQYMVESVNFHVEAVVNFKERSNWLRIRRSQAYVFRFLHNCKAKCGIINEATRNGPIMRCEYRSAENTLFIRCQRDNYADEIACLLQNPSAAIPKTSCLYKDAPYIDEEGVLRSNSRLANAENISEGIAKPVLLPKRHQITDLILNYYHQMYHHVNSETAVNECRQKFIIPSLRVLMKSIINKCQYCKNKRAKAVTPYMANVPAARVGSFMPAFSFVGVDYFGPMMVRVKRTTEKRWGVILTCLTVRAVHIELATNLTTDSCIMCIQRFICTRGLPREFYSDNGRNLRGASKELETAIQYINQQAFAEKFNSETCQWFFNPPSAPHMGGAWERLVRSIKVTLYEILPTRQPTEEMLDTMLQEVANIINSRPLTYVPLNNDLEEALTPNHFLLFSSNGKKPMGQFTTDVWNHKGNWKRCEEYSNRIWKKWRTVYLPDLRRRTTFNEHHPNLKVGDIAILCDDDLPKNHWPKATVIATYPSKDGRVRKVRIKTAKGIYLRPASKLAVLDVRPKDSTTTSDIVVPGRTVNAGPSYVNDATNDALRHVTTSN